MIDFQIVNNLDRREDLLSLFRLSFGHDMPGNLWNWKYLDNPAATENLCVIVATDRGKIVGARPIMPLELWFKNIKIRAVQTCDIMVHPDYQRQGLNPRIIQHLIEYLNTSEYMLWFRLSNLSFISSYARSTSTALFDGEHLFKIQNLDKLIFQRFRSKRLANGLGLLHRGLQIVKTVKTNTSYDFQIEMLDKFNDELNSIDSLRDRSRINLVRDEKFLKWRFDQHPEYKYKYIVAKRKSELWGYAVISIRQSSDDVVYGAIVDYLIKDNDVDCFKVIITQCLHELNRAGCDVISVFAHTVPVFREELLKHFNFRSSIRFPYNKLHKKSEFRIHICSTDLPAELNLFDKQNWYVTYAFFDDR